jgi:hypothetical protein
MIANLPLTAIAVATFLLAPVDIAAANHAHYQHGWWICKTTHFEVWGTVSRDETVAAAATCEQLRAELCAVWYDGAAPPRWPSRCVVALHADPAAYAAAVSQPGTRTVGCTTLQVDHGRITFRRIDLRCDRPNWHHSTLPHELTHAVLADRLGGRPLPLWADEGLAVLSEPDATRRQRDGALIAAISRGAVPSVRQLVRLQSQPSATYRDGFYGQSAMLVSLLIERDSPAAFLAFLERGETVGVEAALRECYGIDGVAGLEQLWEAQKKAATPGSLIELTGRAAIAARMSAEQLPVVSERAASR